MPSACFSQRGTFYPAHLFHHFRSKVTPNRIQTFEHILIEHTFAIQSP